MKAVVFDMDGVLFDTERLSISCWMETAQKMGLETSGRAHTAVSA